MVRFRNVRIRRINVRCMYTIRRRAWLMDGSDSCFRLSSSSTKRTAQLSHTNSRLVIECSLCRREDGRDKFFIGNVRSAYKSARIRPRTARYGPRTHYVRSKLLYFACYCHALVELLASYRERLFMNRRLRPWNDSPS